MAHGLTRMLDVKGLSYSYAGAVAVSDVSLTVGQGEIVALLGANGAGKSTTVRMIAGAMTPQGGTIHFGGKDVMAENFDPIVHRFIGMLKELAPHIARAALEAKPAET